MAEDINALDTLFASANQPEEDEFFDDLLEYDGEEGAINLENKPNIYPRTPQPRKRKVSVFDLVNALEKALSVYKRRPPKIKEKLAKLRAPEKGRDISVVIKEMHARVTKHFSNVKSKKNKLNFTHLLNDDSKEEKVYTFIPLLYLDNQRKIDLTQQYHFGDIFINMVDQKKLKIEKAVVDE